MILAKQHQFLLHLLVYLNQQEHVLIYKHLPTLHFNLFKPVVTFLNLSIAYLSTSDFKLGKLTLLAKFDVSTPAAVFRYTFVA